MEPYYQDDLVTLYNADALEVIRNGVEFDSVVTDPPYGMRYRSNQGGNHKRIVGDDSTDIRDSVLVKCSGKPIVCFGKWNCQRPNDVKQRLVWSKAPDPGMGDLNSPWGCSDEEIYIIGDGFRIVDGRRANVLSYSKTPIQHVSRKHPTPKPVALMKHLVERCPEGVVFDPFAGSGSTLVACRELGIKSIGVEIDESYCDLIVSRLSQMLLF